MLNAPATAVANVALDWKTGVHAKDWASIAKKDKLDVFPTNLFSQYYKSNFKLSFNFLELLCDFKLRL